MNLDQIMNNRFTVGEYVKDFKISDEDIKKMLVASNLGPTAFGLDMARVLLFKEQHAKKEISVYFAGANQSRIIDGSFVALFVGQTGEALTANDAELMKLNAPYRDYNDERAKGYLNLIVGQYTQNPIGAEQMDILAVSSKVSYLTLKATEMGYGSSIMGGFDHSSIEKYLKDKKLIVNGERVILATVVGKIADSPLNKGKEIRNRVDYDRYVKEIK